MPSSACQPSRRSLPSFPTRRSSDLRPADLPRGVRGRRHGRGRGRDRLRDRLVRPAHRGRRFAARHRHPAGAGGGGGGDRLPGPGRARSEEHTSELQSRLHLVCRLLLASPPADPSPLSLHDALPIFDPLIFRVAFVVAATAGGAGVIGYAIAWFVLPTEDGGSRRGIAIRPGQAEVAAGIAFLVLAVLDRKSTRLNSSHGYISYAVFCLPALPPIPPLFPYTTLFRSSTR